MIDAAKDFHISGHGIAENPRPVFVAHRRVAFSGPGTMAHDCRTPNVSEQVAEFRGYAVQVAGAKTGTNSVVMTIQSVERFTQFKQLCELAKRRRIVIEIVF